MAAGFGIEPCFCKLLSNQGPCHPPKQIIWELSNTDCLGKGHRWISKAITISSLLGRQKSYLGRGYMATTEEGSVLYTASLRHPDETV